MNNLEITDVQIIPVIPKNGLVAFASCVVNGDLYIGNIAIHTSPTHPSGFCLVYPEKTLPNGKTINCVHPITKEAGKAIQEAILRQYHKLASFREG